MTSKWKNLKNFLCTASLCPTLPPQSLLHHKHSFFIFLKREILVPNFYRHLTSQKVLLWFCSKSWWNWKWAEKEIKKKKKCLVFLISIISPYNSSLNKNQNLITYFDEFTEKKISLGTEGKGDSLRKKHFSELASLAKLKFAKSDQ